MPLRELLEKTKLGDVFKESQDVIAFEHDRTTGEVLETLSKHRILSAPVVVREDGQHIGNSPQLLVKALVGFVSVADFLHTYLEGLNNRKTEAALLEADLEEVGSALCAAPVLSLFGKHATASSTCMLASDSDSCRDWALKGNIQEPLITVIRRSFLRTSQGTGRSPPRSLATAHVVHRLAVFNSSDPNADAGGLPRLLGVFSQMDAIRFLAQHLDVFGQLGRQTLTQMGLAPPASSLGLVRTTSGHGPHLGRHHLVTVPQDMQTIQQLLAHDLSVYSLFIYWLLQPSTWLAFRMLDELGACGAAVVAPDGSLAGNLSVSDLRCLAPGLFASLLLPVKEFLASRPLLLEVQRETSLEAMDEDGAEAAQPAGLPRGQSAVLLQGVVTCQATSTFAEVVALAARHSVHRVWVVDPEGRPQAAVTLTDMLRTVCKDCDQAGH